MSFVNNSKLNLELFYFRAFKHFYRGEFGNSCSLVKNLLAGLKENGFNWLFMQGEILKMLYLRYKLKF